MKKYWIPFISVIVISFAVLGWVGTKIYQQAPPIPESVKSDDGQVVFTKEDIEEGQNTWQAMGGMETGSVWGHGSYVAPDWTADWLHREAVFVLDQLAVLKFDKKYSELTANDRAALKAQLQRMFRTNTYNKATGVVTINGLRAQAISNITATCSLTEKTLTL